VILGITCGLDYGLKLIEEREEREDKEGVMSVITDMNRFELEEMTKKMFYLLIESRDALPAISMTSAKLRNIDSSLADRIEDCLTPFKTTEDDPNAI